MDLDESRTLARQIADSRPQGRWPDLSVAEFALMLYVGSAACAFDDAVSALGCSSGRMSDWVSDLERRGILSKKIDTLDHRRRLLYLTPKGRRMLASAKKPVGQISPAPEPEDAP